jgi:hypothetical protein
VPFNVIQMPVFGPRSGFIRRAAMALLALASLAGSGCEPRVAREDAPPISAIPEGGPTIEIDDVYRFYEIFDAANGRPTATQLQVDYLDAGSPGLRIFAEQRNTTGARIADAIAARPEIFSDAKRCMEVLPNVRRRLEAALRELGRLYPEARFPPVTIAIGRGRPVGIGHPSTGVQIGLEALCATDYLNPNVEDRFVHVIAHEFVHVQQDSALAEGEGLTVLEVSLMEGVAEFVAELISGDVAYSYFRSIVAGRELEIETAFVADQDKTDLSDWVYNTTTEQPGDLGYWVGYCIAKAYYRHAVDKRQALRDMLKLTDAKAFLAASGWRPGIELDTEG